ncbi:hypothetical protein GCM10009670_12490 [Citricoccus alkalitolerans]
MTASPRPDSRHPLPLADRLRRPLVLLVCGGTDSTAGGVLSAVLRGAVGQCLGGGISRQPEPALGAGPAVVVLLVLRAIRVQDVLQSWGSRAVATVALVSS